MVIGKIGVPSVTSEVVLPERCSVKDKHDDGTSCVIVSEGWCVVVVILVICL